MTAPSMSHLSPQRAAELRAALDALHAHRQRAWVEIRDYPIIRLPLGRGNQSQVADTVRKVTGGQLEVAAFNSFAD